MKNPEKSFRWITGLLFKLEVPFVISGGLAAKSYGSPRPLNDIDIDVHDKDLATIKQGVERYITFGPARYKDERWDLSMITLNHEGQEIDISGGDTLQICDARTGTWFNNKTNFTEIEEREIFSVRVPVISRRVLIAYKSMLAGDHQLTDIVAIQNSRD